MLNIYINKTANKHPRGCAGRDLVFIKFEMEYIQITGFTCSTVGSDRYENTEYLFVNINL